jgi:hypothetical protein
LQDNSASFEKMEEEEEEEEAEEGRKVFTTPSSPPVIKCLQPHLMELMGPW